MDGMLNCGNSAGGDGVGDVLGRGDTDGVTDGDGAGPNNADEEREEMDSDRPACTVDNRTMTLAAAASDANTATDRFMMAQCGLIERGRGRCETGVYMCVTETCVSETCGGGQCHGVTFRCGCWNLQHSTATEH